jgi:hypothetical protein
LTDLRLRIRAAQTHAAFAVSRELVFLYWSIGRDILSRQQAEGWGAKIIDRLAHDLQNEFPGTEGFSPRNLKYMRSLAGASRIHRHPAASCGYVETPVAKIAFRAKVPRI